jgi:hypothetical protein
MNKRDEWWNDWSQATAASKWGGEMTTDVEAMYQAFKARLLVELEVSTHENMGCSTSTLRDRRGK